LSLYVNKVTYYKENNETKEKYQGLYLTNVLIFEKEESVFYKSQIDTLPIYQNQIEQTLKNKLGKKSKEWTTKANEIVSQMYYKPGLFGMENAFFFGVGYLPLDNILKKYGLSVKEDEYESKIKITGDAIPPYLQKGGEYKGTINYDNYFVKIQSGTDNILLKYDPKTYLARSIRINVDVFLLPKGVTDLKQAKQTEPGKTEIQFVKLVYAKDSNNK